jgi:hypothetical protein
MARASCEKPRVADPAEGVPDNLSYISSVGFCARRFRSPVPCQVTETAKRIAQETEEETKVDPEVEMVPEVEVQAVPSVPAAGPSQALLALRSPPPPSWRSWVCCCNCFKRRPTAQAWEVLLEDGFPAHLEMVAQVNNGPSAALGIAMRTALRPDAELAARDSVRVERDTVHDHHLAPATPLRMATPLSCAPYWAATPTSPRSSRAWRIPTPRRRSVRHAWT